MRSARSFYGPMVFKFMMLAVTSFVQDGIQLQLITPYSNNRVIKKNTCGNKKNNEPDCC